MTKIFRSLAVTSVFFAFFIGAVNLATAHSEPEKARFVSEKGVDNGLCDNVLRPCKSIAYAVQQASKGDRVLVASGSYVITSPEELFYLKSEIVPVLAGFNRFDHFQTQSPDVNPAFLLGVPVDMADAMRKNGFKVITDGKSLQLSAELSKKMQAFKVLGQQQSKVDCVGGSASGYSCSNVDLVAHIPLNNFSTKPSSGNDIWGHVDLNTGNEYAIMGVTNGVTVFDLADPANPEEIGTIRGTNSSWRDIKVYQYYDAAEFRWKAYAYSTVDSASDGVTIIDLNSLPENISLVEKNKSVGNAHNVYISNVDHSLNIKLDNTQPLLQLVGAGNYSGSFHSYSLDNPRTIAVQGNQSSFNGYTHDGASVVIDDSRKDTGCYNAGVNCSVFVDFNENEMVLWDITKPTDTKRLSISTYDDVSSSQQYIHSGWVTEDKRYILLHDEFDESRANINTTVRIFQIDDLRNPVKVGQWTGPTAAIDHNGFVRGNRYYMSTYQRGLTVLDITNPSNPVEVGFFDTYPTGNNASYQGAWGVYPFLPSGLILISDINSGLYVLRDNTQSTQQGSLKFESASVSTEQGTELTVGVQRVGATNSSTSTSVKYELISGSAVSGDDFTAASGTLTWNGSDASTKTFNISIAEDVTGQEYSEQFFVRLYDPQSGATLTSPSYLTVKTNGIARAGVVEFNQTTRVVSENTAELVLTVDRMGGADGEASVDYTLADGTAIAGEDYITTSGTLSWQDGETDAKNLTITIIDDELVESDETFSVNLDNVSGSTLGEKSQVVVTIGDNESNTAPSVDVVADFEANTNQTVILSATASDAEGDELVYLWTQTSGVSVDLNATEAQASFVAPSSAGELEFSLMVTDSRGAESSDSVKVTIIAPLVPQESSGGGSLGLSMISLTLLLFSARKRTKNLIR